MLGAEMQRKFFGKENIGTFFISARCNIYISRLCYDVSVCLSVCLYGSALAHYS